MRKEKYFFSPRFFKLRKEPIYCVEYDVESYKRCDFTGLIYGRDSKHKKHFFATKEGAKVFYLSIRYKSQESYLNKIWDDGLNFLQGHISENQLMETVKEYERYIGQPFPRENIVSLLAEIEVIEEYKKEIKHSDGTKFGQVVDLLVRMMFVVVVCFLFLVMLITNR